MSNRTLGITPELHEYVVALGAREPEVMRRLREETAAMPEHGMQIAPEQAAFMTLLVELVGATRCLEVGTFTGYSALAVARVLPPEGRLVCCDVSEEWTSVGRRYWEEAGVASRIDLRIAPALETLDDLLADGEQQTYDFAFVDADKTGYDAYYDRILELLRPGGLLVFDNMLQDGNVLDEHSSDKSAVAIRALNERLRDDERVSVSLLPLADGVTLARKRP